MLQERSITSDDASRDPPLLKPTPHHQFPSASKIVVPNGFPGAGKLTILKRVKELLPAATTRLLDNHLLIDPVAALVPDRSDPAHHELRRKVRAPVFAAIRKLTMTQEGGGHIMLMTACLAADNATDAAVLDEHLAMARGTDVPLFWVTAHCDQAALEQRVASPARCRGATTTKLADVDAVRKLVSEHRLIEPRQSGGGGDGSSPSELVVVESVDVSGEVDVSVSRLMYMVGLAGGVWLCMGAGYRHGGKPLRWGSYEAERRLVCTAKLRSGKSGSRGACESSLPTEKHAVSLHHSRQPFYCGWRERKKVGRLKRAMQRSQMWLSLTGPRCISGDFPSALLSKAETLTLHHSIPKQATTQLSVSCSGL